MQFVVLGMMEVKVCSMLRETLYEIASLYDIYAFSLIDSHYLDFCGMVIFRAVSLFDYQVKYNIVFFYQQAHMHC